MDVVLLVVEVDVEVVVDSVVLGVVVDSVGVAVSVSLGVLELDPSKAPPDIGGSTPRGEEKSRAIRLMTERLRLLSETSARPESEVRSVRSKEK